uniref:Ribosomal_L18e/L15P domain-containing protein n=1 Tax=Macrostomum lignano TaxID=282301 RepID=A0A1I8GHM9_9PLAT
ISRPQLATTAASAMLLCSLLSRLSFSTAAGRRSLCTAFRSHRFETQAPADKQTVDDIDVDGYDLSLSGEVNGDMPTGRMQQRILTGELLHHSRDGVAKKLGGSAGPTGDYEASYHVRLPRVREYELPRTVASDFLRFNTVVYPPQIGEDSDEERRPAETCVEVGKIAIDRKALLLFCIAVQGMSVQPALDKLRLLSERPDGKRIWRKFGHLAPLCLTQAIEAGVRQMTYEESVEFESEMWIESARVSRDGSYTVLRKNARWNMLHYKRPYSKLQVRIREGKPPKYYHPHTLPSQINGWLPNAEIMQSEIDRLRAVRIYRQM